MRVKFGVFPLGKGLLEVSFVEIFMSCSKDLSFDIRLTI